jgi:capsular polysaccharide transport system ATP-binding protein
LIDEGMAGGDRRFKEKCTEIFEARRAETNLFMVSHHGSHLRQYCDMAAILWNGELSFFPSVDEALEDYSKLMSAKPRRRG